MVGHTEAIVTGTLCGNNAVRLAAGEKLIELPHELAVGDFVSHVVDEMKDDAKRGTKYTFSGSVYFERMKEKGLYDMDVESIGKRVEAAGMKDIFATKVK